ncbi:MAG: class A beta-lactamase-related serine hydrolase [Actinobacteria bacterium]|nr:class A beta-lactamase-related serine hydrolase [Actinomycetota bacterium]MCL5883665.1 class A beta-lactamase-related serine hydrolase [Actinomycetota bacterium]
MVSVADAIAQADLTDLGSLSSRKALLLEHDSVIAGANGKYGITIVELDTDEGFGINQDLGFQAASTLKVPILADLYQQIEQGNISREDQLTYTRDDYEEGSGSIQYTDFGTVWSVAELARKMMKESDNAAKTMLIRRAIALDACNYETIR